MPCEVVAQDLPLRVALVEPPAVDLAALVVPVVDRRGEGQVDGAARQQHPDVDLGRFALPGVDLPERFADRHGERDGRQAQGVYLHVGRLERGRDAWREPHHRRLRAHRSGAGERTLGRLRDRGGAALGHVGQEVLTVQYPQRLPDGTALDAELVGQLGLCGHALPGPQRPGPDPVAQHLRHLVVRALPPLVPVDRDVVRSHNQTVQLRAIFRELSGRWL
jgi:hypothetical protein